MLVKRNAIPFGQLEDCRWLLLFCNSLQKVQVVVAVFHSILNQHIYQHLANHPESISHFTTTWSIFQEVLQYLTCPCTRAKTSKVGTGSPPRHYFTTVLWSLFLYLSTHHIKHSVHPQTKASNIIKQIIEVACKFYYYTLYSLSLFSLTESPVVILEISTTYRLVSYLPAD